MPRNQPKRRFVVDARAIVALGRESIKDHSTALLELVKNSYDAGASSVRISFERALDASSGKSARCIRITDDGRGMTSAEVDARWLRIGYSHKRDTPRVADRRVLGEKGIGRLSADRLGAQLELRSKARGDSGVGIAVDWSKFDKPNTDLYSVDAVSDLDDLGFERIGDSSPGEPGTELLIKRLRQQWSRDDFVAMRREFETFFSPFDRELMELDLLIEDHPDLSGPIATEFVTRAAVITLSATVSSTGEIRVSILDRQDEKSKKLVRRVAWTGTAPPRFGRASVKLFFFPRRRELYDLRLDYARLRAWLRDNCGLRIYRDGARVKPYGSGEAADWIGLGARKANNPAGRKRASYRIAPNQIAGAILVGRDQNKELVDSSAREGLVSNAAFGDLKLFALSMIAQLETYYHETRPSERPATAMTDAKQSLATLEEDRQAIEATLRSAEAALPEGSRLPVRRALKQVSALKLEVDTARAALEEVAGQALLFRGLATIGIMSAMFGHETQRELGLLDVSIQAALGQIDKDPIPRDRISKNLNKAMNARGRLAGWGAFVLGRLRRDRRRKHEYRVDQLLRNVVEDLRKATTSAGIVLESEMAEVRVRGFPMDAETILLNFVANSYAACLEQSPSARTIKITVRSQSDNGRDGVVISADDSGRGIAPEHLSKIWEPLFTTRGGGSGGGTGLGLAIVSAIVAENGGNKSAVSHGSLGGAHIEVWLPANLN